MKRQDTLSMNYPIISINYLKKNNKQYNEHLYGYVKTIKKFLLKPENFCSTF